MTDAEIKALPPEDLFDHYMESMQRYSLILFELRNQLRAKPLVGGLFGHSGFVLVSHWTIRKGLDEVEYYVADTDSSFVFSRGESKAEALQNARLLLAKRLTASRLQSECAKFKHAAQELLDERRREFDATREQRTTNARSSVSADKVRSIGRRRRQIFDASEGKCHYCETVLTLDGKWHVEHKMPKALGGDNQPGNLVASCVPCNVKKRDTTDVEFKARIAKEKAA